MSDDELIRPAKEGMQYIIDAAIPHGIKRIVVTSSLAVIVGDAWKKHKGENTYTEEDYAPLSESTEPYVKSKIG